MNGDEVINICFHGIGTPQRRLETGEDRYWINADLYHRVLDEVAGRPDVRISFDDGNASDVEIGLEGLLRRGLQGTFFVLAGRIGAPGSLDQDAIRRLAGDGMVIGTHGMDHRTWRALSRAAREREFVEARRKLEDVIGSPVDEAALPMGQYDRRVLRYLRQEGYSVVHTSDRRPAQAGAWLQPRFSVRRDDTIESIRHCILAAPHWGRRLGAEAVGLVKRLR